MDRWDRDSRRDGGDGWALDASGEWVSKEPGGSGATTGGASARPAASARPSAARAPAATPDRARTAPPPQPEPKPEPDATAAPPEAKARRGVFGTLLVGFVIPFVAATAVLFVWKGPGREVALAQIEPFIVQLSAYRGASEATDPSRAAPPSAIEDCGPVHRGMAGSIVFQRSGECDRAR